MLLDVDELEIEPVKVVVEMSALELEVEALEGVDPLAVGVEILMREEDMTLLEGDVLGATAELDT